MIFTLAGHVDHGKTSIVKALTGVDTDRLEEEKKRGLTIDLGFAYTTIGSHRVGFVDVPGHHRFIHNMIAGVANLQHALVVIAADDGIMTQTREHIQILDLLGLQNGTIVLNKIDRVERKRIDDVRKQSRAFTRQTFLSSAPILEVSAEEGIGIEDLRKHLHSVITNSTTTVRDRAFRMAIDRSFSVRGIGTIVTGTITSGSIQVNDQVAIPELDRTFRVRNINTQDRTVNLAVVGDRAGINIAGVASSQIRRGMWIQNPTLIMPSRFMTVQVRIISDFPRELGMWVPIHVYHMTSHAQARFAPLTTRRALPGSTLLADISCEKTLQVKVGDALILRDHDLQRTCGGCIVIAIGEFPTRRTSQTRIDRMVQVSDAVKIHSPSTTLESISSEVPIGIEDFCRSWNLVPNEWESLVLKSKVVERSGQVMSTAAVRSFLSCIENELTRYHKEHPNEPGINIPRLAGHLSISEPTINFVLHYGLRQRRVKYQSGLFALTTHAVKQESYNEQVYQQLFPLVNVLQPPTIGDLAKSLKFSLAKLEKELRAIVTSGALIRISPKRCFTPDRIIELANIASTLSQDKLFTVREFRDVSSIGRNTAIEVLEFFDRQRFTSRNEDFRAVIGNPDMIL